MSELRRHDGSCPICRPRSSTVGSYCLSMQRAGREWLQQFLLGLGQIDPGGPIRRSENDNLPVMIRSDIGTRCRCQHGEIGALIVSAIAPNPGDAEKGSPLRVKRCLAFGLRVPLNSKIALAGMRQRRLSLKLRPSERKLNTGLALGRPGGKPHRIGANSIERP